MAVKIYNRLSEDSIGRDSKIQELNYLDEYDIKRTPEYGVTNVDGCNVCKRKCGRQAKLLRVVPSR